jgi:hypothetical protein
MFPVRYVLGLCISEDGVLHSHRRKNLRSYVLEENLPSAVEKPISRAFPSGELL